MFGVYKDFVSRKKPQTRNRQPARDSKPSTHGRRDRTTKVLPDSIGDEFEGDTVMVTIRDGGEDREIPITVCSSHPHREVVKETLESANQTGLSKGKNALYCDIASDSPSIKNVREKVIECMMNDTPLVIRRFGKRVGGIGKTSTTKTLDGFLDHFQQADCPAPYCQILGKKPRVIPIRTLRQQFKKLPKSRPYVASVLGFPLMNSPELCKHISFPEFLEDDDLLRYANTAPTTASPEDFHQFRQTVRLQSFPPECGFGVVSMAGSYTGFHEDNWATFVCTSEGLKVWRLKKGSKVVVVILLPGDMLWIPPRWKHDVYSPQDSLMLGGHFILPEILAATLLAATCYRNDPDLANDPSEKAEEYFKNIILVHFCRCVADFEVDTLIYKQRLPRLRLSRILGLSKLMFGRRDAGSLGKHGH